MQPLVRSTGRKTMPTPYSPGAGSEKPRRAHSRSKKRVRNLDQNARAVAGLRIATASAAMRQVDQNLDALQDDVVRFAPLDIGDKPDAAPVVLMLRAVESLSGRQSSKWIFVVAHTTFILNIMSLKACKVSPAPTSGGSVKASACHSHGPTINVPGAPSSDL